MSTVKRYTPSYDKRAYMEEHPAGNFIALTDYATLQAERDGYREALSRILDAWGNRGETTSLEKWNNRMKVAIAKAKELPTPPAGLRWTTKKPTEPGWYWWRDVVRSNRGNPKPEAGYRFCICQEIVLILGRLVASECGDLKHLQGEWAGPLQAPEG